MGHFRRFFFFHLNVQWNLANSNTQGTKINGKFIGSSKIRSTMYKRPGTSNAYGVSGIVDLKRVGGWADTFIMGSAGPYM